MIAHRRKKSATRKKKTTNRRRGYTRRGTRKLPNWSLLILGLAIGVVLVVTVQWISKTSQTPGSGLHNILNRPKKIKAVKQAPKPKTVPKPDFDFYTILPESETVIPDKEWQGIARTREPNVRYVLQAAAYNRYADADRLKARLALNGLESKIQKIIVGKQRTYYRVRLGPFDRPIDAEDVHRKLQNLGIRALKLKVKTTN